MVKLKDLESEKVILGGMLNNKERINKVLLSYSPSYFSSPTIKNLYTIVTKTFVKHTSLVTNSLISNYLESSGVSKDARLEYLQRLDSLREYTPNDAEFAFALQSVKKAYVARCVSDILQSTTETLNKKGGVSAFNKLDKKLYDLKLATIDSNYMSLTDVRQVDGLLSHLENMRNNPDQFRGINSGWSVLDNLTGGFQKGEYVLVITNKVAKRILVPVF